MKLKTMKLTDLKPYENNPRYNEDAVEAVMESIEQCDYIQPIVIDEENVILCGHTRLAALTRLGWTKAQVILIEGLTDEQKKEYRLYDNKTSEIATWDYEKLLVELEGLDLGDFSYFNKELEKMADKAIKDSEHGKKEEKIIICPKCGKVVKGPALEIEGLEDEE